MNLNDTPLGRRNFIKGIGAAAAGALLAGPLRAATEVSGAVATAGLVPKKKFAGTPEKISILGIGGHTLATAASQEESNRIVDEAIDHGVNFMDNAWEYHNGRGEEVMGKALKGKRDKVFLMSKMCTHGQGKDVGLRRLEDSLRRLQTDHLDLWMIHQLDTQAEVDAAFAPGGSVEALDDARKQGKIRYVGFTGHQDPKVHLAMLKHDYAFDGVLVTMNAFNSHSSAGFRTQVLPVLNQRNIAALGFKSLGGNAQVVRDGKLTAEQAIRFALSQTITSLIVGMKSVEELRQNLKVVQSFKPLTPDEQKKLMARFAGEDAARYCRYLRPGYRDGDSASFIA
jgi:predicted aldo/keto reductase-like oxidoreductase